MCPREGVRNYSPLSQLESREKAMRSMSRRFEISLDHFFWSIQIVREAFSYERIS